MAKHFYVNQNKQLTEQVNSDLLKKIYDLVVYQNNNNDCYDILSDFIGKINTRYTYHKYINTIGAEFTNLDITYDGLFVSFEDPIIEQKLIENYGGEIGGILQTLTVDTSKGFFKNNNQIFKNNTEIETFNELNQFSNIKLLGQSSFENCTNLKSITLDNITSIGGYAFYNCTSLSIDVNCPNLITFGERAFMNSDITSITSLGYISSIPNNAFYGCKELTTIDNGVLTNIGSIGQSSFSNCKKLQSIVLPQNLTNIKGSTFYGCSSLESINLPETITSIDGEAFRSCTSLTINNLYLPNLSSIGNAVFYGCKKLKHVSSLGNITEITGSLFLGCSMLDYIDLSNMTKIGGSAFSGCTLLTIKDNNLTNVKSIGAWAFANCSSLTGTIDLGDKLESVDNEMFQGCNVNLIIRSTEVPEAKGYNQFQLNNGFYVYVLDNLVDEYKETFTRNAAKFKPLSEIES